MKWIKYIFKKTDDFIVSLADPDKIKQDCPVVNIPVQQLWERDSLKNRLIAILKLKYRPNEQVFLHFEKHPYIVSLMIISY